LAAVAGASVSVLGSLHVLQRERQRAGPVWFALDEERPLAFFAGIWTAWTSVRRLAEGEVTADLFGFLTIDVNREVGAVHPKAMPMILTREEELNTWLSAPWP
jgi:putative SOS response-associated peptidase YedK